MKKVEITSEQRKKLERLWMHYGNKGPKTTHGNHRFIQCILEHGEYNPDFYRQPRLALNGLSDECLEAVNKELADKPEQA